MEENINIEENINLKVQNAPSLSIPVAIIIAGFLIAGGIYFGNKDNAPKAQNIAAVANSTDIDINPISKEDHILGNPDALVTLVEFSDTECPFCKRFHVTMQTIINTYGKDGKVAWVYRHFPLDSLHPKARKEAEATECVNNLGGNTAFWKMLDTIYANTPSNNGLDQALLPEFAKLAGVDVAKFNSCLESGKFAAEVNSDFQDAVAAGAQGTPYNVLVLKNKLSSDAESTLQEYILKNGLGQNIIISSSQKEIVLSGALPVEMVKIILDVILK